MNLLTLGEKQLSDGGKNKNKKNFQKNSTPKKFKSKIKALSAWGTSLWQWLTEKKQTNRGNVYLRT